MPIGGEAAADYRAQDMLPRRLLTLAVAALVALTGCSVGPHYRRPPTPAPASWSDSADGAAPVWPAADWWREFGSAELGTLIAKAEAANDDLAAAVARVREADAQRRIAGAPLLPSVNAAGSATRQRAPVSNVGIETYDLFTPGLSASYELDFWGKNRAALAAATASAAASRYDREVVELTVLSSVATTYFEILELRDRLQIVKTNLDTARHILRGLKLEQQVGTATGLDVAQQETAVDTLNASVPPLQEQLRQSIDALAILVGDVPQAVDVTSTSMHDLTVPTVGAGLPSGLLTRRPDVAEAEAQLVSANANIQVARAALFPNITLTATGGYESDALSNLLTPAARVWSISAGLMQPIFAGGALRGQVQYSQARYAELVADYHKAVISAFGNVEDSLVALQATTEQQKRQQLAVDQANKAYRYAEAQMQAGTINVLTLLNTQSVLFGAEDTLAQVQYARLQAIVGLYKALGGGWQAEPHR